MYNFLGSIKFVITDQQKDAFEMLRIYDDFKVCVIAVSIPIPDEILCFTKVYNVNYSLEDIDVNFYFGQAHS